MAVTSVPKVRVRVDVILLASILVMAAVLVRVLFLSPAAGYADNSDYDRIMIPAGFQPATPDGRNDFGAEINFRYRIVPPGNTRMWYLSSERIVAIAVRFFVKPFLPGGRFDLRILGAAHALLLLAGIGVIIASTRRLPRGSRVVAAAMTVFFFSDIAYIALLNSFYSQVASFVFLLLAAGFAGLSLRDPGRSLWPTLYFMTVLAFVTSKPQETSQVIPAMALFLVLAPRSPAPIWRRPELVISAAGAVVALTYFVSGSAGMKPGQTFNLVFNELVPASGRPAEALAELGLPPKYLRYVGRPRYGPESPMNGPDFRDAMVRRMSYPRIVEFYLRHPTLTLGLLKGRAAAAFAIRDDRSGRFSKESGLPPGARAEWPSYWSRAREACGRHAFGLLVIILGGNLTLWTGAAVRRFTRAGNWKPAAAAAILSAMALESYGIVALASMPLDGERKLLTFDVMVDLLLIADVVAMMGIRLRGRRA